MISSNDFSPGITIEYRDAVWQIVEAMHVKPGKGSAFVQTKLRNLVTGDVLKVNFRAGERVPLVALEKLEMQYLYRDGVNYVLMDSTGENSLELNANQLGDKALFLVDGLAGIIVLLHQENIIRIDLPNTVDLRIRETPPNERGDTSSGGGKRATLETGVEIMVPFHMKAGD